MADATVMAAAQQLAQRAAKQFALTKRRILVRAKAPVSSMREDGCCWRQGPPGISAVVIELRLHRANRPRQSLKRSTIMACLAHELAHLKHDNHDAQHGELTRELASYLRSQGQPVSHVLHSNTATAFLPAHKKSKRARKRRFKRAWKRPAARTSNPSS